MSIKNFLKKVLLHYQVQMWYAAQADNEYAKIGRFITPTLSILTLLRVSGTVVRFWQICVAYLIIMGIAVIVGRVIVKMGIVSFNNKIANNENLELKEIVEWVRERKKIENE